LSYRPLIQAATSASNNLQTLLRYGTERCFRFLDDFNGAHPGLRIGQLNTGHVTKWLAGKKGWNSTTKCNAITALMRAFNWATKNMGLGQNPITGMEKPEPSAIDHHQGVGHSVANIPNDGGCS
jgi:hypothetical protein